LNSDLFPGLHDNVLMFGVSAGAADLAEVQSFSNFVEGIISL